MLFENPLFDIIHGALPKDFEFSCLFNYGKPEWWQKRPEMALAYALRKCPGLDWQAYDSPNVDAVWHFVRTGVFEGRKVPAKNCVISTNGKFTIVVEGCENEFWLERSLKNLASQPEKNLEILLPCNLEERKGELEASWLPAEADTKFIATFGMSRHQARMAALSQAAGNALIFINPPYCIAPGAISEMRALIEKGYDFIKAGFNIGPGVSSNNTEMARINVACNCVARVEHAGSQIWPALKKEICLYPELSLFCGNIQIMRKAFAQVSWDATDAEAPYLELEAIAKAATTFLKIPDRLLLTVDTRKALPDRPQGLFAPTFPDIRWKSAKAAGSYRDEVRHALLVDQAKIWLTETPPEQITDNFNGMARDYGVLPVIQTLRDLCPDGWEQVAGKFQYYKTPGRSKPVKSIGILYGQMLNGGIESAILDLSRILLDRGYQVTIFLRFSRQREMLIDSRAKIVHLPLQNWRDPEAVFVDSLRPLERHARDIDLMLLQDPWSWDILWKTMLLKYCNVPVFLIHHFDFYLPLLYPDKKYNLQANAATFRCLDKMICQTKCSELYFRNQGINAQYIYNPIKNVSHDIDEKLADPNNVVVVCRLAAPIKQTMQSLKVLAELRKIIPAAKMTFVGFFNDGKFEKEFYAMADSLGVRQNIVITGWTEKPDYYMQRSACLLSTSYGEGFPLSISEAQAKGRPVVMYYLPIAAAENNASIVRVEQGDYRQAARELAAIMGNRQKWRSLANLALEKCAEYAPAKYIEELDFLIRNYAKFSTASYYSREDYRETIRILSFYTANLPPWLEKAS